MNLLQVYVDMGKPKKATGAAAVKSGYSTFVERCWFSSEDPSKGRVYTPGMAGRFVADFKIATLPDELYNEVLEFLLSLETNPEEGCHVDILHPYRKHNGMVPRDWFKTSLPSLPTLLIGRYVFWHPRMPQVLGRLLGASGSQTWLYT